MPLRLAFQVPQSARLACTGLSRLKDMASRIACRGRLEALAKHKVAPHEHFPLGDSVKIAFSIFRQIHRAENWLNDDIMASEQKVGRSIVTIFHPIVRVVVDTP